MWALIISKVHCHPPLEKWSAQSSWMLFATISPVWFHPSDLIMPTNQSSCLRDADHVRRYKSLAKKSTQFYIGDIMHHPRTCGVLVPQVQYANMFLKTANQWLSRDSSITTNSALDAPSYIFLLNCDACCTFPLLDMLVEHRKYGGMDSNTTRGGEDELKLKSF